MRPRDLFSKAMIGGFILSAVCGGLAARLRYERRYQAVDPAFAPQTYLDSELPSELIDRTIDSPGGAKRDGLFWLSSASGQGAAVRLRDSRKVFEQLFPGYEAARLDESLWKSYFRFKFNHTLSGPEFTVRDGSAVVGVSSIGNLELFRRYGAAAVLFGTSEAYHGLAPFWMRERLIENGRAGHQVMILDAMQGGVMPETVRRTAREMAEYRHVQVVVWGYSFWNAYKAPDYLSLEDPKWAALENWRQRTGFMSVRPSDFFGELSWDAAIKLNLQSVRDEEKAKGAVGKEDVSEIGKYKVRQGRGEEGSSFLAAAIKDDRALLEVVSVTRPFYSRLAGITEKDCDLTGAEAEFDRTLRQLRKLADRVVIYIPPTTPLQTDYAPACFLPAVRRMLLSRRSASVRVDTGDWSSFGLNYRDFISPDKESGRLRVDINHVNADGARKISVRVADMIEQVR